MGLEPDWPGASRAEGGIRPGQENLKPRQKNLGRLAKNPARPAEKSCHFPKKSGTFSKKSGTLAKKSGIFPEKIAPAEKRVRRGNPFLRWGLRGTHNPAKKNPKFFEKKLAPPRKKSGPAAKKSGPAAKKSAPAAKKSSPAAKKIRPRREKNLGPARWAGHPLPRIAGPPGWGPKLLQQNEARPGKCEPRVKRDS